MAVIGYIITGFLCTAPELSTVDNKVEKMAVGAVRILYDVLEGKDVQPKMMVTPIWLSGSC